LVAESLVASEGIWAARIGVGEVVVRMRASFTMVI
jgi:hypothetical protein